MISPIHVLKRIPLFASLSEADQLKLIRLLRREKLRKGEILFRQGDEGRTLYLILQGRIRISLSGRTDTVTLAILGQGEDASLAVKMRKAPKMCDAVHAKHPFLC